MVDAVIAWLKVAVMAGMMATPVAALAGGGGGVPDPETDPPHPATRSAAGNRREAILKRIITIYLRFSRMEKDPVRSARHSADGLC
jgi:hypothetical protein